MVEKGHRYVEGRVLATLGFIELSRGDPKAAHQWLQRVVQLEETGGYDEPTAFHCDHNEIEALIQMGQLDEADALVHRLERRGQALDRAWALAVGARCRGLLCAAQGDLLSAQAAFERAGLPAQLRRAGRKSPGPGHHHSSRDGRCRSRCGHGWDQS